MEQSQSGPRRSSRDKGDYPGRTSEINRSLLDTGIFPNEEFYSKKRRGRTLQVNMKNTVRVSSAEKHADKGKESPSQ